MSAGAAAARRHAWLELLQTSGPFLTLPVADQTWPAGLPAVPQPARAAVRTAAAQVLAGRGRNRDALAQEVLCRLLGWGDALVQRADLPATLVEGVPEHGVILQPDFAFCVAETDEPADELARPEDEPVDDDEDTEAAPSAAEPVEGRYRLLGMWTEWGRHPLSRPRTGWVASPVERLAVLLRARDVPLGVVSDGRWWALVHAPRGRPVGVAVWDASLWSEEPETLEGFAALLERRRFLGVAPDDRLPRLLQRSGEAQEEVTTALGSQVRAAVEMLVRRLDELDRAEDGRLLAGVSDDDLYAGVVTVMMRVVFLLFAEERRLLPNDDDRYESSYSVGRLAEQLEQRAHTHGRQTLEHRTGAWHRLLALSRALHGGVAHPDLRLPPYGGDLFDPARFPWLEGRDDTGPPAVDDLTVLHMLAAVQMVTVRGERRRLSFRALDVEQIGYVYEGLLELEVRTATDTVLQLTPRGGIDFIFAPRAAQIVFEDELTEWTASAYLGKKASTAATRRRAERLLGADVLASTVALLDPHVRPLAPLVRLDDRDRPLVTPARGRFIAPSSRRASTGAHYTPRFLAEEIVKYTLEPLVYRPGPLESLDRTTWVLRPASAILNLRVADIAMGSGAFLVAACRFLADLVVEAWRSAGDAEATRWRAARTAAAADAEVDPVALRARRLVAQQCLYGVDANPLAVEMGKLSLWLITMDRERPFGFLDDRLVCGDSLLGIASLDQLETLHLDPVVGRKFQEDRLDFNADWRLSLARSADERRQITGQDAVTVRQVEIKQQHLRRSRELAEPIHAAADALTGAGLRAAQTPVRRRNDVFTGLADALWRSELGDHDGLNEFIDEIDDGLPAGKERRRPLHWPLEFPEVFADTDRPGFDAIIGNPPYLGGQKVSGAMGSDYLAWLQAWDGGGAKGSADLSARFCLRADRLLNSRGQLGYVTNNTLVEGDTLAIGLLQLEQRGWTVRRGVSSHAWPSASASLSVVEVWASKAPVLGRAVLDDEPVPRLGVDLQPFLRESGRPVLLVENDGLAFQGSNILGLGFTLEPAEAQRWLTEDPTNADLLFPYVIGADLNRRPDTSASRWVINFQDWTLERAERYVAAMNRVRDSVKPERDRNKRQTRRERWWWFAERAPDLYSAIADLDHVLAISLVGNVLLPVRVPTGQVFAHACGVFALENFASLALLSSAIHQSWGIRYTSTMDTRIRYAPSDVFLTLPRPESTPGLHELGETLDTERRQLMLGRALGLTKLYNQVHDPSVTDPDVIRLRDIHTAIDHATLAAYGWSDLDPDIGHHPTKIGTRWTVSPTARFELLDRLLVENHRRAALQQGR